MKLLTTLRATIFLALIILTFDATAQCTFNLSAEVVNNVSCFGQSDGSVRAVVSGSDYQESNLGKIDLSVAGSNTATPFDSTSQGVLFDVNTDTLTIDTVTVYPYGTGDLVVRIKNSSDQILFLANYPISGGTGTATKIPIGLTLPPGTNYKMDAYGSTIGGSHASSGGMVNYATYFSSYSVLNIKNSLDLNTNRYWFFYDWTVTITPSVSLNWSNAAS